MLVMNGHSSHMTCEFLNYTTEHKICLFTFPVHSTHITQPLNVKVFQPYKHWHAESVDQVMHSGATEFNKLDFFHLFPQMKAKTMTPATIRHAWEKTGLYSYNSDIVLNKIRQVNEKCVTPS